MKTIETAESIKHVSQFPKKTVSYRKVDGQNGQPKWNHPENPPAEET
jgi:hypothetical protein